MIDQLKRNRLFYAFTTLFLFIGLGILFMIETGDLVLYFDQSRNELSNIFFSIITQFGEASTYVVIVILLLFIQFRYALIIPIIGGLVTAVAFLLKVYFRHPRPALFFRDRGQDEGLNYVDGIDLLTGLNSFPSGHTMSAFCLFGFLAYVLHTQRFSRGLQIACFVMALLVGFSRIYLFQHFLKDIVFGAFLGTLLAVICITLSELPGNNPNKWWNKSLPLSKYKAKV